jgi:hypothetical protein
MIVGARMVARYPARFELGSTEFFYTSRSGQKADSTRPTAIPNETSKNR